MTGEPHAGDSLQEMAQALSAAKRLVIVSHFHPDGDAHGSALGLGLALEESGREVYFVNESPLDPRFASLPGSGRIARELPPPAEWDMLVACDCGSLARVGDRLGPQAKAFPRIVNIDHHVSNDRFGTPNLVVPTASSTCEIVYELIHEMKIPLSKQVATCLFAGITWDTGGFSYASTSPRTFVVASHLVASGARPSDIARDLFAETPIGTVRLHAEALLNVQIHSAGRIAEVLVRRDMYARHLAKPEDTEGLVERAREIGGVLVAILIREEGELWKVSLRGKDERLDLSTLAGQFGGGGHKLAAAFRWRKSLDELRPALLAAVNEQLSNLA